MANARQFLYTFSAPVSYDTKLFELRVAMQARSVSAVIRASLDLTHDLIHLANEAGELTVLTEAGDAVTVPLLNRA